VAGLATPFVASRVSVAADKKAPTATFEVYQDRGGEYRWRLKAQNGNILATASEGYKEKRDCLANIESVKKAAADAPVQEQAAAPAK
jgi:uncharacterized protein YegP (UPF0339 family)